MVARGLRFVLDNDVTDLCLSFPAETPEPSLANAPVTNDNKHLYITAMLAAAVPKGVRDAAMLIGFGLSEVIPPVSLLWHFPNTTACDCVLNRQDVLAMFSAAELSALLCGPRDINVDDWQRNTVYGTFSETDQIITWFWQAVRSFDAKVSDFLYRL